MAPTQGNCVHVCEISSVQETLGDDIFSRFGIVANGSNEGSMDLVEAILDVINENFLLLTV
jgi:hypothetical protein